MTGKRDVVAGVERYAVKLPPNTVRCDVEGCGQEVYVERRHYRGADAREQAAAKGWGFLDGRDLCPKHLAEAQERE